MSNKMKYVRKHYHKSSKAGIVYCCSSYELKACLILDGDKEVAFYETQIGFVMDGRKRIADFIVCMTSGSKKIIEVKPASRLSEYSEQIEDNRRFAATNGCEFEIWTETNLGFKDGREAVKWADSYLSQIHGVDYVEYRKELCREKAKRYYRKEVATNKVTVHCNFCNCDHEVLELNYKKNIERNGRYICEREGGFIAGSKPKKKKVNPYAAESKKHCPQCNLVKDLNEFGVDKHRSDGYADRCKDCRAQRAKKNYEQKRSM